MPCRNSPISIRLATGFSALVILIVSLQSGICAQVVPAVRVPSSAPIQMTERIVKVVDTAAAKPEDEKAKEESAEDKLVKALLEAKFERTTQAILKAWSKTEKDSAEAGEQAEPISVKGSVANYYDGLAVLTIENSSDFKPQDVIEISLEEETAKATVLSVEGAKVVAQLVPTKPEETTKADPDLEDGGESNGNEAAAEDPEPAPETNTPAEKNVFGLELTSGAEVWVSEIDKGDDEEQKVETLVRNVTLGQWDELKSFLKTLEEENANKVYTHILTSLAVAEFELPAGVQEELAQQVLARMERGKQKPFHFLTPDDILQLSEAAPSQIKLVVKKSKKSDNSAGASDSEPRPVLPPGIELPPGISLDQLPPEVLAQLQAAADATIGVETPQRPETEEDSPVKALATLIQKADEAGHDFNGFIEKLVAGTTHFGTDDRMKRLTTADLLMKGGLFEHVQTFLPPLDDEKTQSDVQSLKIWSELALQQYSDKKVPQWLAKAWQINQAISKLEEIEKQDMDLALSNLIELSSKVDKELGQKWLNESFTDEPERGRLILSSLGTQSATMAKQAAHVPTSKRLKLLTLQNRAVENLLEVSPENAFQWTQAMTLLGKNWLTEAETSLQYSTQNSRSQFMRIDMYGNYYWLDQKQHKQQRRDNRPPAPIELGDMLEIMPSPQWQKHVSRSLHTRLRKVTANLYLRVNEEDQAFPYIEEIAKDHPEIARELVHEFLRIWTKNHDPNTNKRQRNPYIYFYGFDQKADAIPLTRSKQERNLAELSKWVSRIRELKLDDIDEDLLANAFTSCHSSAEVFRLGAVKSVFGDLGKLKSETISALAQKMRVNLSANWRDIRKQEEKQTNRREPEVQKEVLRGYDVALKMTEESLQTAPDSWHLHLAKACLMYDQNAYSQTVQKSSEFSARRDLAFGQFELAATKYADVVSTLEEKDQSTDVYDYWFYAALGACDLGKITDKTVPDLRQYPKIRESILGLSGELSEKHMAKVANNMFTRMSPVKPELKFRYLRGGFAIVGDHPRAWEATSLFDYYKDLISEIKLDVRVDGSEDVGHDQPFGVYVNLLHTEEIERESGGFKKYVQNQNNMPYAYNYGRPTEDYRTKFTDSVEQALEKHYEILNVTFVGADEMQSIPAAQDGWRLTPYAYLLLKPRGSEIDRIAPLKLDLDFLDTSGYVVIPIESPAVVIDASAEKGAPRPIADLQVTQTLDERQADEGKLVLEVSASAKGLVPDLEEIMDVERDKFEVVSVDDQGVLPTKFDKESDVVQIHSDRSWTIEYTAKEGVSGLDEFAFGEVQQEEASTKFQRYEDADLVEVEQTVALEKRYESFSWRFLYWLIPLIAVGLFGMAGLIYVSKKPKQVQQARFNVPEDINPFTVLTLLKDIKRRNGISNEKSIELENSINRVEQYYFGKSESEISDDLKDLAQQWVNQAK